MRSGYFDFTVLANGHLIGEFFNDEMPGIGVETAERLTGIGYIGTFRSVWFENGVEFTADLTIGPTSSTGRHSLSWRGHGDAGNFSGSGVMRNGVLTGYYLENNLSNSSLL